MQLSKEEQHLVDQRLAQEKKSTGVAYLILFFLGYVGGHRFYLGQTSSAVAMLIWWFIAALIYVILNGLIFFIPLFIRCIIDVFLIPGMISEDISTKRSAIVNEISNRF